MAQFLLTASGLAGQHVLENLEGVSEAVQFFLPVPQGHPASEDRLVYVTVLGVNTAAEHSRNNEYSNITAAWDENRMSV